MSAETDFLNDALGQAGCDRITNLNDDVASANWCRVFYKPLRRAMLELADWNFAEDRASLAQALPAPAFEYSFAYGLPTNLLKIKQYNGFNVSPLAGSPYYWMHWEGHYKIEGARLLTNDTQAYIMYTKDIDNPALFDSLFYQMLSTALASKLASAIKKDSGKSNELLSKAMDMWLPFASAVAGQEDQRAAYISDSLIRGR